MNLFDYKKLLKKVLGFFAAGLLLFAIGMTLVILVLQPIIWVTNMLGRISEMLDFNPQGAEKIADYREDLDKLTEDNHIAFRYSDMLACSMNEKYTHDIKGCAAFLQEDGTFEKSIDLGPAESFRLYSKEIEEYQGKIPDSAYEDIWIPTLYEMDHYKEEPVIDEETGQPKKNANGEEETEWVFDYTEEEPYKDYCVAYEPETKCRKTREGFFTFPYIPPAGGDIQKRYGYDLTDVETSISLQFKTAVGYGPGYVLAVSTGDVIETGSDENGSYAIQKINNNGTEFYAKYTGISLLTCEEGKEYEQNEILGRAEEVEVKTWFDKENEQQYFNPMLLFSTSSPWKYEDTFATSEDNTFVPIVGGIIEIDGVLIDFGSKFYSFSADGVNGNPCVCDPNNRVAWPYNNCISNSITGSFNKMICSSYAAGRYWEVNNPSGNFPLPRNWDQLLTVNRRAPGEGSYSTDPNNPIAQSIVSIRFGGVLHDAFIEGVGEDGSVVISECNASNSNQYGFRVRKYGSLQDFLNSYGATLNGMYGP